MRALVLLLVLLLAACANTPTAAEGGLDTGPKKCVECKDGLSKSAIQRVIHRHQLEIKWCYERALERNANELGGVTMTWFIQADGSTKKIRTADWTLTDPEMRDCLVERVRRWKFPRPKGGGKVLIRYPYRFMRSDLTVDDGIDKTDVMFAIVRRREAIDACYQQHLETDPLAKGNVTIEWSIRASGHPANVRVNDAGEDVGPVATCVEDQVWKMKFEPPSGSASNVEFQWDFDSGSGGFQDGRPMRLDTMMPIVEKREAYWACLTDTDASESGGIVTIDWVVDPDGAVSLAVVGNATPGLKGTAVPQCILGLVAETKFPGTGVPRRTSYHFRFDPHDRRAPRPGPGVPRLSGAALLGSIRALAADKLESVLNCYRKGLDERPDLGGEFKMRMLFLESGEVEAFRLTGMDIAEVRWCLQWEVDDWTLPPLERDTVVTIPFAIDVERPTPAR